ncbi:efflux transporter outer membrane subunit [Sphingomonas sp. GB1N7]|uniref:efflux transporter outer membrane subunit n=1 Tax=Parasphingomonas caseinilytica TaxID=3096158 RepID=UPI002FC8FC37
MRLKILLLAAGTLAGCTMGPDYHPPEIGLTPGYMSAAGIAAERENASWWSGFDDPILVDLVARATAGNLDIAQAEARITQARAVARAAGAALLPSVDAAGSVVSASQSRETPVGKITQAFGQPRGNTQYAVGAEASWEIDLFGGLRRGREAARADLGSAEAQAAGVRIAIAAETADAYVALRGLQARLAVAERQRTIQAQLVDLIRQRVDQGLSANRELNRATGALEGVRASLPPLRAGVAAQLNRIDVLVGEQPGTNRALLIAESAVPTAPAPEGSGAPTELLRRRPDIVAAERRLAAANARIGVSIADYYPHLSLSGLLGVASLGTGTLFTGNAVQASGGAGLRWRLFDFGRVDAEVAQARGAQAEALAAWRGSVLKAAEDVETALSRLSEAHVERGDLARQIAALTKARAQADQAYAGGVVALIEVIDADRELLAASDRQASVQTEEARAAIAAYRALGGGWHIGDTALASNPAR